MTAVASRWKPGRALEIVAGTPPGGGLDRAARALVAAITENNLCEVPVSVVNVPGDGARAAWRHIDRYPGDAHVVSISSPNLTTDKLVGLATFDQRDYTPLAILYTEYIIFIARPDSRIKTAADLVRQLGEDPSVIVISLSTTLGNPNHIAVAQVARAAGIDVTAPKIRCFDTALDVVADVVAGKSDVGAITVASVVKELNAGNIRPLAISSPARLNDPFAAVPTWPEAKVDCVVGAWRGVTGPAGLGPYEIGFWQSLLSAATNTDTWRRELAAHHWADMYVDDGALERHLERERAEYTALLTELGLVKKSPATTGEARAGT